MSYVVFNVLTVPEGAGEALEQRFAARVGMVENAPGFEHFELLRPTGGSDRYIVYTRFATKEQFDGWMAANAAGHGHGQAGPAGPAGATGHGHGQGPISTGSEIWQFDVVTEA